MDGNIGLQMISNMGQLGAVSKARETPSMWLLSVDDNGDGRGLHRCGLQALQIVARYSVTPFECCGQACCMRSGVKGSCSLLMERE